MENLARAGRASAIIAYITIFGTIIAYFMNNDSKNPFAGFHIRQALGVHLTFYMLGLIIPWFNSWAISIAFWIFILVLWGYGLIGALQGEKNEVPFLGCHFQNWFRTIK